MKRILGIVLIIFVLIVFGFAVWGLTPSGPTTDVNPFLVSSDKVDVDEDGSLLVFTPTKSNFETGLIFYPGGHVDFRSYAPLASYLAENGYKVVITPMPLSLAVLNSNAARKVISSYPEINNWIIGGHSLGGAMAASFAFNNLEDINGLVLLASYPTDSNDLSGADINVLSIFGSEDGLVSAEEINHSNSLLPKNAIFIEIPGGNHAQMGWYGDQAGDGIALISRAEQQSVVQEALLKFLKNTE